MQVYTRKTLVMIRNSARESKKGDKMKPRWLGPYLYTAVQIMFVKTALVNNITH